MRAVFRVDASLKIGTGHVMRCLALAQVLKENGVSSEFICRQHEGNLVNKIRSDGFLVNEFVLLEDSEIENKLSHSHWLGVTQQQDADECINILKSEKTDWLIVDHYALDEDWQRKLHPYYEKLMVIDDLADRNHQCDILLDQTFGRQQCDYESLVPTGCEFLLGSQYALLRPEFSKWRSYSLERRSKLEFKKLLVNMGGVDVDNFTGKVLDGLKTCTLPSDVNITVIMGKSAPHLEIVQAIASVLPYKIVVKVDVENMAEIMANSDVAIGAAGTTSWERCCLGLPTLQVVIAKNQIFSSKVLARKNAVKFLKEIKKVARFLEDPTEWMKDVSHAASQVCDGMGAYKVFSKMTNYKIILENFGEIELCDYVNLSVDDKVLALNMRNHPQIKKWMYNQNDISKASHFDFIKSLKNNENRCYFLVKQKENVIGSINFSQIDLNSSVEFGLYTNPFVSLKGAGSILVAAASYYACAELGANKLKLEVFSNNERAIDFYKKCGFKLIDSIEVNNQNIFVMEKRSALQEARE